LLMKNSLNVIGIERHAREPCAAPTQCARLYGLFSGARQLVGVVGRDRSVGVTNFQ
jgi:hypothetical protein